MMGSLSRAALFSLVAAGEFLVPPYCYAEQGSEDVAARESARRQMAVRDSLQQVQEARHQYQAKKYSAAVEHYRNALSVLPKSPATREQEKFIKLSLSDALIAKAIDYRSVGRTQEALDFLIEAKDLAPDNKRAVEELLRTQDSVRSNPALTPQHVGDVEEVNRLLALASGYSDLGKFDEALSSFNSVLRIDPHNEAARRGMEAVHRRRSSYYAQSRNSARAKALSEVDRQWEEPIPDEGAPVAGISEVDSPLPAADAGQAQSFADALENMVLPQIIFDGVTLPEALEALRNQIRRMEAEGVKAGRPINISTNWGGDDTPQNKELLAKTINLNLSNVSVKAVMDVLCRQLGVQYNYTPTGVEFTYSGKDFGPLVDRIYTVAPHFFDSDDAAGEEDDEEDAFASSSGVAVRRINPAQTLKTMGVSFPKGSFAQYSPSTRRLKVRNTAYNHDQIKSLLELPLEGERDVLLNVIMMEVNEEDMEELGFEWMMNMGLGGETFLGGGQQLASSASGVPMVGGSFGREPAPSMSGGLRSGIRRYTSDALDYLISQGSSAGYGGRSSSGAKAPGILSFYGTWTAADVQMVMRGLSQKKGTDFLSNPRVILSPGREEQVTFANVHEFFYPESYTDPQITEASSWSDDDERDAEDYYDRYGRYENDGAGAMVAPAHPDSFTYFGMTEDAIGGIGPIMQVHKVEVLDGGQNVSIALSTTYNRFEGFINWGSPINIMRGTVSETAMGGVSLSSGATVGTPNYILMPVIKRYYENTELVLRSGSVVVIGGLKESKKVRFEDKIPVLGDLPLVGRLFRSEGESKNRRMFLIFAKVDVVDPTGVDVNTGKRPSEAPEAM